MARPKRSKTRRRSGWRARARATGGRIRRSVRRHVRAVKMGILAKTGIGIATLPPLAFAGVDGFKGFMSVTAPGGAALDFPSKLAAAAAMAINSLAVGFGMDAPYAGLNLTSEMGKVLVPNVSLPPPSVTKGAHFTTAVVGGMMVGVDLIYSAAVGWATKRRGGTKIGGIQTTSGK